MVGADGIARVVDFGVAKAAGRLQETREGQLKGKIRYMAPEQLKRGEIDRAADIYAASVVLWESLTGRRLFDDDNEWKIAHAIVEGAKDPPSKYAPAVPASLDAIVMRGLAPERSKRFATAFEMAVAIEDAVQPATARQVSSWLERVAADVLQARASKLAEIEGQSNAIASEVELASSPSSTSGSWPSQPSHSPRASHADIQPPAAGTEVSNLTTAQWERATERVSSSGLNDTSEPSRTAAGTANSLLPGHPRKKPGVRPSLLGLGAAVLVFALGLIVYVVAGPGKPSASAHAAASAKPAPVESVATTEKAPLDVEPAPPSATRAPEPDKSAAVAPAESAKKPPTKKTPSGPWTGFWQSVPQATCSQMQSPLLLRQGRREALQARVLVSRATRLGALALLAGSLVTGAASADDAKAECVAAHADSQKLRTESKLKEASEKLLVCSRPECPGAVRSECAKWLSEVQGDLPSLVVVATDANGNDVADVKVSVDGAVAASELSGQPLLVNPGPHTLRFEREGANPIERKLVLRVGERNRRVEVQFTPGLAGNGETPPTQGETPAQGDTSPSSSGGKIPTATWILGGVGVVGLASFTFFALDGKKKEDDLASCKPNCAHDDVQKARTSYLIGDISLGVGVVALAGAAYFYFSSSSSAEKSASRSHAPIRLDVFSTRGGASGVLSGSF